MATVVLEMEPALVEALRGQAAAADTSVESFLICLAEKYMADRAVSERVDAIIDRQLKAYRPLFERLAQ